MAHASFEAYSMRDEKQYQQLCFPVNNLENCINVGSENLARSQSYAYQLEFDIVVIWFGMRCTTHGLMASFVLAYPYIRMSRWPLQVHKKPKPLKFTTIATSCKQFIRTVRFTHAITHCTRTSESTIKFSMSIEHDKNVFMFGMSDVRECCVLCVWYTHYSLNRNNRINRNWLVMKAKCSNWLARLDCHSNATKYQ